MKTIKEEIMMTLQEHISKGIYQVSDKLPSIRELSNYYHVNPNTISGVYEELEKNGLIKGILGKGYYVCEVNDTLRQYVLTQIQENTNKIMMSGKLIHQTKQEILQLVEKEMNRYDPN